MHVFIIGSTGLLGQAVSAGVLARGWQLTTAARSGAEVALDIANVAALEKTLNNVKPDLLINCAALTDINKCEQDPALAHCINARPLTSMAHWSMCTGRRIVHVSTDHYYTVGGSKPHGEKDQMHLVNEYARSKFASEGFALAAPNALVFRTSIVGVRGWGPLTFAEWAIRAVLNNEAVGLFTDAYTSSIDVKSFATAALDIASGPAVGILNLASSEIYSKAQFVQELAAQLGYRLDNAILTSLKTQKPPRAGSLGLDVSRAQALLRYPLPGLADVVRAVLDMYRQRSRE